MRAFAKRCIWFFGCMTLSLISYAITQREIVGINAFWFLLIAVMPLFWMEDDEGKNE